MKKESGGNNTRHSHGHAHGHGHGHGHKHDNKDKKDKRPQKITNMLLFQCFKNIRKLITFL